MKINTAPHAHSGWSVRKTMIVVLSSLLPAAAASVYFFGLNALILIAVSLVSAVTAEYAWQKWAKKPVAAGDLSAAVTGLLFALTLPPGIPYWLAAVGAVFAVLIGKQVFGGIGFNLINPALAGRAFLQIFWPKTMMSWLTPFDAVSTATPLTIAKHSLAMPLPDYLTLFLGNHAGSLGETCIPALLAGALVLALSRTIFLSAPLSYIITVAAGAALFGEDPLFHVLGGGLMLGAFFMATDPVTSPVTKPGRIIFGIGCGILTVLMRVKGFLAEGVCFSILAMNLAVPLLDRWIIPKPFGRENGEKT